MCLRSSQPSRKVSVSEQQELIPDSAIRAAFLERPEIAVIPPDEQERLWARQLAKVDQLRELFSKLNSLVIEGSH